MADSTIIGSTSGLALVAIALVSWNVWCYLNSPLRKYPGPWLAKWTNLWRFYHVARDQYPRVTSELHRKYGPVICVGPHIIDVDHPDVIRDVFNQTKSEWRKTIFYEIAGGKEGSKVVHHVFSERDPASHARMKRPIAKYYSMPSFVAMESHIDTILEDFCSALETRFVDKDVSFDLGDWLLYYAWDIIGQVTFSKSLGYLEKGCDYDGTLALVPPRMQWFITLGMLPWFAHYVYPLPFVQAPGFDSIIERSNRHVRERRAAVDKEYHDAAQLDLLDRFLQAKAAAPDAIDDRLMASWLINNFLAGADSTAAGLTSVLYFAIKKPHIGRRLREELIAAGLASKVGGTVANHPVSYNQARSLPYLEAVVREAVRIVPGVSMPLERYVPEGGYTLPDGSVLPAGTTVGINPYVTSRNTDTYGEDADDFRPERWLQDDNETTEQFQQRLAAMNAADLGFGGGTRSCLGKNMALIQLYKMAATIIARYDLQLAQPDKDWKVAGSWFPRQLDVLVKASSRRD